VRDSVRNSELERNDRELDDKRAWIVFAVLEDGQFCCTLGILSSGGTPECAPERTVRCQPRARCAINSPARCRVGRAYLGYGTPLQAYRAIDAHVYDRVRNFLVKRHKVQGRGTRHFPARPRVRGPRCAGPQARAP
jgi:hypothetical protein